MRKIEYSTKSNKNPKSRFGKFNLKNDVIYDALKLICNKNLERPRKFGDIGSFGDMGTGKNKDKNRVIA
jgi:hypothetical protein